MTDTKNLEGLVLKKDFELVAGTLKIGPMSGVASLSLRTSGTMTATAMANSSVYFGTLAERQDWVRLPQELERLDITHLRMLSEIKEPVKQKLVMLTNWQPELMPDETIKLAATSVLNEKLAARERSHARTLQWIAIIASIVSGLAGIAIGYWLDK
ncbi:MAG TPA: hypothetical protein VK629_12505 [Steroidobacteraceae bacterium]|nr:hypothetical protein [Steroidobacteraceae bacterium]